MNPRKFTQVGLPSDERNVIVITGASAGIGRATAREFGMRGARVALIARGAAGLEAAKFEVESMGGEAELYQCDVSDFDALKAVRDSIVEKWGRIDVWVNNAMVTVFSSVTETKPEEFKRVSEVNYLGTVYGSLLALETMREADTGSIVLVGSALAYRGLPLQSAYCASKHAVEGFFDSLRAELAHDGSNIRVTMVQLSGCNTPQFKWAKSRLENDPKPMGIFYQPEIAAEVIHDAAYSERREIYVGASAVKAIVANKVAPAFMDWYLGKTAYKAQQTKHPAKGDQENNLWEPINKDFGAHGPFDKRAKDSSVQVWATTHKPLLALAIVAASAAALFGGKVLRDLEHPLRRNTRRAINIVTKQARRSSFAD